MRHAEGLLPLSSGGCGPGQPSCSQGVLRMTWGASDTPETREREYQHVVTQGSWARPDRGRARRVARPGRRSRCRHHRARPVGAPDRGLPDRRSRSPTRPGCQLVEGFTVTEGTKPTSFTGKVIGVLEDGIGPDLDMIMMSWTPPRSSEAAASGRACPVRRSMHDQRRAHRRRRLRAVLGAVPVAGITPYETMDEVPDSAASPARQVDVGSADASRIAAESTSRRARRPRASAGCGSRRPSSGVPALPPRRTPRQLRRTARPARTSRSERHWHQSAAPAPPLPTRPRWWPAATSAPASRTATSPPAASAPSPASVTVDLVGFGHPMMFSGRTTLSMHPANALYVQESPWGRRSRWPTSRPRSGPSPTTGRPGSAGTSVNCCPRPWTSPRPSPTSAQIRVRAPRTCRSPEPTRR